jgi:hypothetical protein
MATELKHLLPMTAALQLGEGLKSAGLTLSLAAWQRALGADFEQLGLMDRGRRLSGVLRQFLPSDFRQAAPLLVQTMGRPMGLDPRGEPVSPGDVVSSFYHLPHSMYIAEHGLDHLPEAMQAQHALTQRGIQPAAIFANAHTSHLGALDAVGQRPQRPCAPRRE